MLRIFISYRRGESSGYSRLVRERLGATLPEADIFMDVEDIPLGADWRSVLGERIAGADTVLVLIGHEWLTLRDSRGNRRLDDPEDVTCWEIATALQSGKRVIPVLLEGQPLHPREALPEPLGRLGDLQAIELHHETFEAGLETLVARLTQKRLRDLLTEEHHRLRLERIRRWGVPVIGLSVFLLAWVQLFDILTLDTRIATWTLAIADAVAPIRLDDSIALIGIAETEDPGAPEMRARYGELLDKVSAAGAARVVLDIHFHQPRDADADLEPAIRSARNRGTEVFFSFVEEDQGIPRSVPSLAAAASGLGLACLGRRLGYAFAMPLAYGIRFIDNEASVSRHPALAILGSAGPAEIVGLDTDSLTLSLRKGDGAAARMEFSRLGAPMAGKQGCEALAPDTRTAELLVRLTPADGLLARRIPFDVALSGSFPPERVVGKTLVVGYESEPENFRVAYGLHAEQRYGYQLHAEAINTLLTGRILQSIGPYPQLIISLLIASAGAGMGILLRATRDWRRWVVGTFLLATYGVAAIAVAAGEDILLNSAYDIGAFAFSYLLFRRLSMRWLP